MGPMRELLSLMSEEAYLAVVEPAAHRCHPCSKIRKRSLPLRGTSTKHRQCFENQEVDENEASSRVVRSTAR
jgi:hypothetical protein